MEFKEFGFYTIDIEYLKYLHAIDQEVYYNPTYENQIKPFLGILVTVEEYTYLIPLTSAKEKHKTWKNVSNQHFLIYELVDISLNIKDMILKQFSSTQNMHVLAILDIKKMIPVPENICTKIDFSILEYKYRDLFLKEYDFCLRIKEKILKKATITYKQQITTSKIFPMHCNYRKLEEYCKNHKNYKKE